MKKLMLICLLVSLSFSLSSEDAGKYADVKAMLVTQFKVYEDYIKACDNAKEVKDVVLIMNNLKDSFKKLLPEIKTLVAKYGKFEDLFNNNVPEELQPEMDKLKDLTMKMMNASMKLAAYSQLPEVKKAQQELNEVMKEVSEAANPAPPEKKEEADK